MSCLNLRLPPAKKTWRSLTSRLQKHLHKLNKSKNIKKTRPQFNPASSVAPIRRSSLLLDDHNKKRRLFNPFKPLRNKNSFFFTKKKQKKKSAPVYIDKLFIGPVAADQEVVVKYPSRAKTMKVREIGKKHEGEGSEKSGQGDTMWESIGFASPVMRGIDERAEQFIASFRAEMEVQEIIDRDDDDSS